MTEYDRLYQEVEALAEFWEAREDGTPEQQSWAENAAMNLRAVLARHPSRG